MNNTENQNRFENQFELIDEGSNRIFVDLIFALAAGECFREGCTYDEQLEYYIFKVLPDVAPFEAFLEYVQKYRTSSMQMFPARPDKIKNRKYLIKLFASFVMLKELYDCDDCGLAMDYSKMSDAVMEKFAQMDEGDKYVFRREVTSLARRYASLLDEGVYRRFREVMAESLDDFENAYSVILENAMGEAEGGKSGSFARLLKLYEIPEEQAVKFHLEVDAIAETVAIKNKHLVYEDEFKSGWRERFPDYPYDEELEKYVQSKQAGFYLSYGNNISQIRNENFLFVMLADVTVKLALVDGAKNIHELQRKIM